MRVARNLTRKGKFINPVKNTVKFVYLVQQTVFGKKFNLWQFLASKKNFAVDYFQHSNSLFICSPNLAQQNLPRPETKNCVWPLFEKLKRRSFQ